jgi:hypothetical protein
VIKESMFVKTSLKHTFIQEIGEFWLSEKIIIQEIVNNYFIDSIHETSWIIHECRIWSTKHITMSWTKEIQLSANRLIKFQY